MEVKKIMGYESKIYIIEKTKYSWDEENGMKYARVLAMFDVSKFYELSDWFRNKPATKHYFYADDGDTEIIEDRYGVYRSFNGNTFVKDLMVQMRQLPSKPKIVNEKGEDPIKYFELHPDHHPKFRHLEEEDEG